MKRQKLVKHIERQGCFLLREGKRHAIFKNPVNGKQSAVGRHRELSDLLCDKICKRLGIPKVKESR